MPLSKKGKKPKVKPTKVAAGKALRTHAQMDPELFKIGQNWDALAKNSKVRAVSPIPANVKSLGYMKKMQGTTSLTKKSGIRIFRTMQKKQDEFVSSSASNQIALGMLSSGTTKTAAQQQALENIMDQNSGLRAQTQEVVTAAKVGGILIKSQHPPGGFMGRSTGALASQASNRDRKRKSLLIDAIKNSAAKGGSLQSQVNAGAVAVTSYTMDEMFAPVTASNILPHTEKAKKVSIKVLVNDGVFNDSVMRRDALKYHAVNKMGGIFRPLAKGQKPFDKTRMHNPKGDGRFSPPRFARGVLKKGGYLK